MKIQKNTYYIPEGNTFNRKSTAWANAMATELMNYGINISDNLFERICHSEESVAQEFCKDILEDYTVGKLNPPLFKNWESRTYFSFNEVIVQICGYMLQISGNDLENLYYRRDVLSKVDFVKKFTIELASEEEASAKFDELVNAQVSQDKKTQKLLGKLSKAFPNQVKSKRIKSDEARIAVLLGMTGNLDENFRTLKCKPSDALRFAAAKRNFETVKLPSNTLYASLPWRERKQSLEFLESFDFEELSEAMAINRECWTRYFKHNHIFTQSQFVKYDKVQIAANVSVGKKTSDIDSRHRKQFDKLSEEGIVEILGTGNTAYRSYASRIATAIETKDFYKILSLCDKNYGYLLRNLSLVASGVSKKYETEFVDFVRSKIIYANVDVLFSILQINVDAKYRAIDAKGTTTIQEAKYPQIIKDIQGDIRREIHKRFGFNGKVVVEDSLKNSVIPFLSKNSDLPRGTRIKIDQKGYLYFFTHWIQKNQRTDLDLSFVSFDSSWNSQTVYFGNQANNYITHSGDITNAPAPNGATEYGKISLNKIPKGVRYILPITNVFAGSPLSENIEAYSGFMTSDNSKFSVQQDHTRYNLSQPANSNIPFILDVENMEILIVDFNNNHRMGMTAHSEIGEMKKLISASEDKNVLTIGVLADILSGEDDDINLTICENPKDIDEIFPDSLASLFVKK